MPPEPLQVLKILAVSFMSASSQRYMTVEGLRAILANAPNSIPPERVFSILNNTFGDDQGNAMADYIELALQLQFNERSRSQERAV